MEHGKPVFLPIGQADRKESCRKCGYGIAEEEDAPQALGAVARIRNCLGRGGEPDYGKAAAILVDEFRSGKIGRFTLEVPGRSG